MASAVVMYGYRDTVTHQTILEQVPDVLCDVEALISVVTPVGEDELAALPNARAVISPIIGYDWIDVEAATARGVLVANGEASENYESIDRKSVVEGKSVSVRVDLGGRRIIKKKNTKLWHKNKPYEL